MLCTYLWETCEELAQKIIINYQEASCRFSGKGNCLNPSETKPGLEEVMRETTLLVGNAHTLSVGPLTLEIAIVTSAETI